MIFYVTVLRALAACLITNAHYTGIYPVEIIANGGLLGDGSSLQFRASAYVIPRRRFLYGTANELSGAICR